MHGPDPTQHTEGTQNSSTGWTTTQVSGCSLGVNVNGTDPSCLAKALKTTNSLWNHRQQWQSRKLKPNLILPAPCPAKTNKQTSLMGFKQDLESYNRTFKTSRIKSKIIII